MSGRVMEDWTAWVFGPDGSDDSILRYLKAPPLNLFTFAAIVLCALEFQYRFPLHVPECRPRLSQ